MSDIPLRVFIGKHPCDDQPWIADVDPDPRSGDPRFSFNGPDYSGWYVAAHEIASPEAAYVAGTALIGSGVLVQANEVGAVVDVVLEALRSHLLPSSLVWRGGSDE